MNRNTGLWVLFILLAAGWGYWTKRPLPRMSFEALPALVSQEDPCAARPYCVVLYLAPWCPHCQTMVSKVPELRSFWTASDRPGLKVVIGADQPEKIDAMAASVGDPVYKDLSGEFGKRAGVDSYPSWFVIDPAGRTIERGRGAVSWVNREVNSRIR